jgi:2-dehydro-3-deoxyphosphooctonate aldolase (KDO 8-P synthase)
MKKRTIKIGKITIGKDLTLIAGVCSIENENQVLKTARFLKKTCQKHKLPLIFKASFDKANRLSIKSYRGPGIKKGLEIIDEVKKKLKLPVLVDVHCVTQINEVKKIADVIQIPAFLSRQTDLLVETAKTGLPVNIKKAQFLSPQDMKFIAEKAASTGNRKIMLTERGTSFGYGNLVVDFRSIVIMKEIGYPVIFDATHSVQLPGGGGGKTAGQREFIFPLIKAAVAVGVDGIYLEIHPAPAKAKSDSGSVLDFKQFEKIAEFLSKAK